MKYILSLIYLFAICFVPKVYSYKDNKAILVLSKDAQADSLGHNFVTGFSSWIYKKIKDGTIKIYDSPLKNKEIRYVTLHGLEVSSKTSFPQTSYLFIYESWSSDKHETGFRILGFRFMNENKDDEIDYGYVDYPEIENALKKAYVNPNINGSYKTSFYQILMNKEFDYDLLYFHNSPIQKQNSKDPEEDYRKGLSIKEDAFNSTKTNLNYVQGKQIKLIEYVIKSSDTKYDKKTEAIITALEEHFENNRRDLYNYGGIKIYKNFKKSKIIISKCTVKEFWIKKNETIEYKIIQILPHSLGIDFQEPIKFSKRSQLPSRIMIKGDLLENVLKSKDFNYRILKINNKKINPQRQQIYLKALKESKWYMITYYVRDYYRLKFNK